jgi:Protein of unknown function (DUF992)
MRLTNKIAAACFLIATLAASPAYSSVNVGVLKCDIDGGIGFLIGSSRDVNCTFRLEDGSVERYEGTIGKLGIDLGVTGDASLAWLVFAPGKVGRGALSGSYTGVSAQVTAGAGLGANVLVGGFRKSINLQPLSVQGQTGLNLAAGLASLSIRQQR